MVIDTSFLALLGPNCRELVSPCSEQSARNVSWLGYIRLTKTTDLWNYFLLKETGDAVIEKHIVNFKTHFTKGTQNRLHVLREMQSVEWKTNLIDVILPSLI